ncbi:MAG: hypothetical protein R3F59_11985 [Myxococcota bacterium]
MTLTLGLWAALGTSGSAVAAEPAVDPAVMEQVVRLLSSRDEVSCAAVEALAPQPVAALRAVVAEVQMPPYAPMRAAGCLVTGHAVEVQADLERWVVDPELKGLGRLVLGAIDRLPKEVAVPVVQRALAEGSDPELARRRAASAALPEVRALVVTK